jgi:hypothetical protein
MKPLGNYKGAHLSDDIATASHSAARSTRNRMLGKALCTNDRDSITSITLDESESSRKSYVN